MSATKVTISKVYSSGEQPLNTQPGRIWLDTNLLGFNVCNNNQEWEPIRIGSDNVIINNSSNLTLTSALSTIGDALDDFDKNKANNSDVVKLTGDQDIKGIKNFEKIWISPEVFYEATYAQNHSFVNGGQTLLNSLDVGHLNQTAITINGTSISSYDSASNYPPEAQGFLLDHDEGLKLKSTAQVVIGERDALTAILTNQELYLENDASQKTITITPQQISIWDRFGGDGSTSTETPHQIKVDAKQISFDNPNGSISLKHEGKTLSLVPNSPTESPVYFKTDILQLSNSNIIGVDTSSLSDFDSYVPSSILVKSELSKKQDKLLTYKEVETLSAQITVDEIIELSNKHKQCIKLGDGYIEIDSGAGPFVLRSDYAEFGTTINGNLVFNGLAVEGNLIETTLEGNEYKLASAKAIKDAIDVKANIKDVVLNSEVDATTIPASPSESRVPSTYLLSSELSKKVNEADVYNKTQVDNLFEAVRTSPLYGKFTGTTANTLSQLTNNILYADKPGKIIITPAPTNKGAVYIREGSSNVDGAFPLYPDQIITIPFTDITEVFVGTELDNEAFSYIASFGYNNTTVYETSLLFAASGSTMEVEAMWSETEGATLTYQIISDYVYGSNKLNDGIALYVWTPDGEMTSEIVEMKGIVEEGYPQLLIEESTLTKANQSIPLQLHNVDGVLTNKVVSLKVERDADMGLVFKLI